MKDADMKAGKGGGGKGGKGGNGGWGGKGLNHLGEQEEEEEDKPKEEEEEKPYLPWMLASLTCKPCGPAQSTGYEIGKGQFGELSEQDEDAEEEIAPNLRETMEQEKEKNDEKREPKMGRIPKKSQRQKQVWPLWRSDTVQSEPKPEKREVYALRKQYQGSKPVQLVVDSAAVDCVMPKKILDTVRPNPEAPLTQGAAAKAGINYVAADGGEIPN